MRTHDAARRWFAPLVLLAACKKEAPRSVYQAIPVERRDIIVSAQAAGIIQPDTTVEVKSKASGEILEIMVETGQLVQRGAADGPGRPAHAPEHAGPGPGQSRRGQGARLPHAQAQLTRADELFKSQSITETEYEQAMLDYANAKAAVVGAEVAIENAKIRWRTATSAPRSPARSSRRTSSAARSSRLPPATWAAARCCSRWRTSTWCRSSTLVDETDIGKIQPGLRGHRHGRRLSQPAVRRRVLKVEPLATTQQNVTMFPVHRPDREPRRAAAARA